MDALDFIKLFYKYLMEKYNWNPAEIQQLPYWKTYELEFGEFNKQQDPNTRVYEYADQLPF